MAGIRGGDRGGQIGGRRPMDGREVLFVECHSHAIVQTWVVSSHLRMSNSMGLIFEARSPPFSESALGRGKSS